MVSLAFCTFSGSPRRRSWFRARRISMDIVWSSWNFLTVLPPLPITGPSASRSTVSSTTPPASSPCSMRCSAAFPAATSAGDPRTSTTCSCLSRRSSAPVSSCSCCSALAWPPCTSEASSSGNTGTSSEWLLARNSSSFSSAAASCSREPRSFTRPSGPLPSTSSEAPSSWVMASRQAFPRPPFSARATPLPTSTVVCWFFSTSASTSARARARCAASAPTTRTAGASQSRSSSAPSQAARRAWMPAPPLPTRAFSVPTSPAGTTAVRASSAASTSRASCKPAATLAAGPLIFSTPWSRSVLARSKRAPEPRCRPEMVAPPFPRTAEIW
mmetsp:Transcript_17964/g.29119  ORF Transcript_17964/g.29119 Transcript_17964/m.29119 type:complete len:329 (-) Transcript_17964:58-1044(-)